MVEIRSRYDEHERPAGVTFSQPSMTKQEFKTECDVNMIIDNYQTYHTPLIDPLRPRSGEAFFGDFSDIPDLMTAQNKLIEAQEMFMQLPSSIRSRFNNDAVSFVEFCQKEENVSEMRELGILPKLYYREDGVEYYFRDGVPVYTGVVKDTHVQQTDPAV